MCWSLEHKHFGIVQVHSAVVATAFFAPSAHGEATMVPEQRNLKNQTFNKPCGTRTPTLHQQHQRDSEHTY